MPSLEPDRLEVRAALSEDLGEGDITTLAVLAGKDGPRVEARVVARAPCVVAGLAEASIAFTELGAKVEHLAVEGARVERKATVAVVRGPARGVLAAERVALNYLMRMSGIATATRALADAAARENPRCRVAATRKTTPLFRRAEKRAVALGGGDPHRFGLADAFLVKDNHRALADADVGELVRRCRALDPGKLVEVEVESLEDALLAAEAGADMLLLDNQPPGAFAAWADAIRARHPRALLEASGGITPETLPAYARHADRVSLGWLTLSAPHVDFGLDV